MSERAFPIQGGPSIPWSLIAPHAIQAAKNHDQTLERLAERGGLSPCEAVAVLEDRSWRQMDKVEARNRLIELRDKDWQSRAIAAEQKLELSHAEYSASINIIDKVSQERDELKRRLEAAQIGADQIEKHNWFDCGNIQCEQAHEVFRVVFGFLNIKCPDNIYVVGKTIRVTEAICALQSAKEAAEKRVGELEAVLQSLVDWDKANPKGRIYPIGPNDVDKQLDAICVAASTALKAKLPQTALKRGRSDSIRVEECPECGVELAVGQPHIHQYR